MVMFAFDSRADDRNFITDGSLRGRALAMGGAYSSIRDDFSSGLYNPAAFRVNATARGTTVPDILQPRRVRGVVQRVQTV